MVLYSFVLFLLFLFLNKVYFFKDKCGKHVWRMQFCSSFSSSPRDRQIFRETDIHSDLRGHGNICWNCLNVIFNVKHWCVTIKHLNRAAQTHALRSETFTQPFLSLKRAVQLCISVRICWCVIMKTDLIFVLLSGEFHWFWKWSCFPKC